MSDRVPETPEPTVETRSYWEAAARHELTFGGCRACGKAHFYPRRRCPYCLSADTELRPATGRGTVYAFSVMRRAVIPYVIAYVRLDEGVTMMTNIVGCDPSEIRIDMPVAVLFQASQGGQPVPVFAPAA